jgi:hypothetical protein
MRVRLLKDTRLLWEYSVTELEKGEEHVGDLARHLFDNAPKGTVEVLEHDPEEPAADGAEGEATPPPEPVAPSAVPSGGTIDELMAWVGDDPARRAAALAAEQAKSQPRATVLKRLGGE